MVLDNLSFLFFAFPVLCLAGISPVHDYKAKINAKDALAIPMTSPHRILSHLDNAIQKATKNITHNDHMEQDLYQISKDLVSAILSKLEIQDKITRITREALETPGKSNGITAIETRRILDYISRTLSGHILTITKSSTEPELHRLVYGLGQIAAEVSIVSALKDVTYSSVLAKKQPSDISLRKKRAIDTSALKMDEDVKFSSKASKSAPSIYNIILNSTKTPMQSTSLVTEPEQLSPFSVIPKGERKSVQVFNSKGTKYNSTKSFLNKTQLDAENNENIGNMSEIVLSKSVNTTNYEPVGEVHDDISLLDDWIESKENIFKPSLNAEVLAELEMDQPVADEEKNEKKIQQKLERLEAKAKKAILYAGDVAYLAAASVVAMRRALTASIEVKMSVKFAKTGMSNHQDLMLNLARTAAQQAGKEARSASSKSLACEKVVKLALKYTTQSHGAKLNHVASRIVMDTVPLATLAKSMAFVSSDIAINSLYQATDVKLTV